MICPNCGRDFGNSLLAFDWCPGDRAYFCRSCTMERDHCPACRTRPSSAALGITGAVLFILLITSAVLVLPQHISRTLDIQMPITDVINVTPGQQVKVQGAIDTKDERAFSLLFRDGRWQLQQKTSFSIVDSKGGRIRPDLTSCHDFHPGQLNSSDPTRSDFRDGDQITVFGKAGSDEQGNKTLEVRRLYPGTADPYSLTPGWYQTLWLVPTVVLILFVQVLVLYLHRRWLHRGYLSRHPAPEPDGPGDGAEDAGVSWTPSPLLDADRKRVRLLAAASAAMAAALLATSVLAPWAWAEEPFPLAAGTVLMIYTTAFALICWEETHFTPVSLGISPRGLHLRYRPKRNKAEQTASFSWPALLEYECATAFGKSRVRFKSEERIERAVLPRELSRIIDGEYSRRKKTARWAETPRPPGIRSGLRLRWARLRDYFSQRFRE